ncbi:MAG: ligand-binding SRPBCC domain-containing protein [bacterium]|jgi:ligand-binding SRPBCC domain-containing protein
MVDATVEELWDFITNPNNLEKLTPKQFGGRRLNKSQNDVVKDGFETSYKIKILPFISVKWTARFSEVVPYESFVDEQIKGPFRSWKHKHTIIVHRGNVMMRDEITFEPPFPWFGIGIFLYETFILPRIHKLFIYRDTFLDNYFVKQTES